MKVHFFLLSLVLCVHVRAQQDSDTLDNPLPEVVITAQRIVQSEKPVPYAVVTVNGRSFKRFNPRSTPESLHGLNGVFVQKTNHGGGSPIIRGLTGNQTLLMVDGIRLNNATFRYGPNQYLNTIDPYMVNKIEVAKGTGSVQYGTDAMGGVIHVLTAEPAFSETTLFHSSHSAKMMNRDMEKTIRNEGSYSSAKVSMTGGLTYRDFGHLYGGDTTGRQDPSGYAEWGFDAKGKFILSKRAQLTVASQLLKQRHVPVYHKVVLENYRLNEFDIQQRSLQYMRLHMQGRNKLVKNAEVTVSWQQSLEGRKMQKNGSDVVTSERDRVNTIGITSTVHTELTRNWRATSGIDLYFDAVNSTRSESAGNNGMYLTKRGLYPNNSTHHSYSMYSLHQFSFGKWLVDAGLRFNQFSINISDSTLGNVQLAPSAFIGNAAVMYRLSGRHHIYGNYSEGFRAPNIDDLGSLGIVDFRYEVPAYDLQPEKSANLEVGYRFQSRRLTTNVAAYYLSLRDLITRQAKGGETIDGYQVYQKYNSERAFVKGAEVKIDWEVVRYIYARGAVAYTYGKNQTKEEPLRRIPPLNGAVGAGFHKNHWYADAEFLFAFKQSRLAEGDKKDNRIPVGGSPGWQVINMYVGYEKNMVYCSLGLQNIFNADYRLHGSGINGVGRSAWFTVGVNL